LFSDKAYNYATGNRVVIGGEKKEKKEDNKKQKTKKVYIKYKISR